MATKSPFTKLQLATIRAAVIYEYFMMKALPDTIPFDLESDYTQDVLGIIDDQGSDVSTEQYEEREKAYSAFRKECEKEAKALYREAKG